MLYQSREDMFAVKPTPRPCPIAALLSATALLGALANPAQARAAGYSLYEQGAAALGHDETVAIARERPTRLLWRRVLGR